jgi:hypothetical protein
MEKNTSLTQITGGKFETDDIIDKMESILDRNYNS